MPLRSHLTCCSRFSVDRPFPLVHSKSLTCTLSDGGGKHSIWPTCSGGDGSMSTSPPYKQDRSGLTLARISRSMTLYSSARRTHHAATGLSLEYWKSTPVPTDDLAQSNCWYAGRRSYDLFPRSASSNITNNFYVNPRLLLSLLLLVYSSLFITSLFITFLSLRISTYYFYLDTYFSLFLFIILLNVV